MSKSDITDTPTSTVETSTDDRLTGRVKWFNNKAGFGFVTVLSGEKSDEDVFVHHSGIVVESEQYKYLVQGEYVSFNLRNSDNDDHPYQAGEVRGVCSGLLMCETRNAARTSREGEDGEQEGQDDRRMRGGGGRRSGNQSRGGNRGGSDGRNVNHRGAGPRGNGNEEWVLTRRSKRGGKDSSNDRV